MGNQQPTFDKMKMMAALRNAISRITIHRAKKLNMIAKRKDDIAKYLEAGNEVNAKIWVETLINDESFVPCLDVVSVLCDQIVGRVSAIQKFGVPPDMHQTLYTLIYAAPRCEIEELNTVRIMLSSLLGRSFTDKADNDPDCINRMIRDNINLRMPEEGEKINKLVEIAKQKNIDYKPSEESATYLALYLDRNAAKSHFNPASGGINQPMYEPVAPQQYITHPYQGPPHDQNPPYFPPPSGGSGGGMGGGYNQHPHPSEDLYGPQPSSFIPPPQQHQAPYIPPQNYSQPGDGMSSANSSATSVVPKPAGGSSPVIVYPRSSEIVKPQNEGSGSGDEESKGDDIDDFERRLAALKKL